MILIFEILFILMQKLANINFDYHLIWKNLEIIKYENYIINIGFVEFVGKGRYRLIKY